MNRRADTYKILLVDDDDGLVGLMRKHLEREGFKTNASGSGGEAISWLGEHEVDLMLLDYKLPDMTGRELIQALTARKNAVPFILVTGQGDERVAVDMMKGGARDYLVKDQAFLELLPSVVDQVIEQLNREKRLEAAEAAVRESEAQYRSIFNSALDAVLVSTFDGRIIDANPQASSMFGYSSKEFLDMSVRDLINSDQRHLYDEILLEFRSTGKFSAESVVVQKDGTMIDVDIRGSVFTVKGENQMLVIIRDISERKWAEEELKLTNQQLRMSEQALRERETRLGGIFQGAAIGLSLVDLGGRAIESNNAFQKMLGYSRSELRHMVFTEFTYPEDREDGQRIFRDLAQGKCDHYQLETRYQRKDGEVVWVRVTASLIRGASGEPNYVISMVEDISERIEAESALRESEHKYRCLFDNMLNGFAYYQVLTEGVNQTRDYVFLEVNDAFVKRAGVRREDIIGKKITEIFPEFETSDFDWLEMYDKVALSGEETRIERYFETWDRWFSVSAFRPQQGYLATIFADITERRLMEEELRIFTAQVEKHNRDMKQCAKLFQGLRRPLKQIVEECHNLEHEEKFPSDSPERQAIKRLNIQADRLGQMFEELSDHAQTIWP
jgi:two-component system cell cycle sensor histidine kinase/response regulator CckA